MAEGIDIQSATRMVWTFRDAVPEMSPNRLFSHRADWTPGVLRWDFQAWIPPPPRALPGSSWYETVPHDILALLSGAGSDERALPRRLRRPLAVRSASWLRYTGVSELIHRRMFMEDRETESSRVL